MSIGGQIVSELNSRPTRFAIQAGLNSGLAPFAHWGDTAKKLGPADILSEQGLIGRGELWL